MAAEMSIVLLVVQSGNNCLFPSDAAHPGWSGFSGVFLTGRRLFGSRTRPVPTGACPAGRCVPAVPECLVPLGAPRAGSHGPVTKQTPLPPVPRQLAVADPASHQHRQDLRPRGRELRAWHQGCLRLESVRLSLQAPCVTDISRADVHPRGLQGFRLYF